jgi:hypothetical protein
MTTTMMTFAAAASAAQKNKKKTNSICKWSGEDDEYHWRGDNDEDTVTMTADEQRYINWYHTQAHIQWRDDDVASPTASAAAPPPAAAAANNKTKMHVPFMNLAKEERDKKSKLFNFGLCSDCDAGLDDESEFVCKPRPNAEPLMTCNACSAYYLNLAFMRVGCGEERGGCN